jgi:hypothetical protein
MTLGGTAMSALPPVSELLAGATVVALVPATAELDRAAALAWDFARAAATAGIHVALVDGYVDEPRLHEAGGQSNDAGVVDVFEYGVSLTRIARAQPEGNLSFVAAGTYAPDRVATMAHPGWRRLAAEFAREHVTLLLFMAPECLGAVPVRLDGIVALAPGADAGGSRIPGIASAVRGGVRLIATLTGEDGATAQEERAAQTPSAAAPVDTAPPAGAVPAPDAAPATEPLVATQGPAGPVWSQARASFGDLLRRRQQERRRFRFRIAIYAAVLVLGAEAVVLIPGQPSPKPVPNLAEPVDLTPTPAPVPPAVAPPAPATARPTRAVEPLPFAVELLSSTTRSTAFMSGDDLEHAGIPTLIAPVRIGRRIWYRVYAGPVATQRSADSLLDAVTRAGLGSFRSARAVRVPLSFALRRVADSTAVREERARLRRAGIPSFLLGRADGAYELFAGAFAARAEAAYLGGLLRSARSAGVLGPREGRRR